MKIVWIEREEHSCTYERVRDKKLLLGSIYYVDTDEQADAMWGDDWDDTPEHSNASAPHRAIRIDIHYGDSLEDIYFSES